MRLNEVKWSCSGQHRFEMPTRNGMCCFRIAASNVMIMKHSKVKRKSCKDEMATEMIANCSAYERQNSDIFSFVETHQRSFFIQNKSICFAHPCADYKCQWTARPCKRVAHSPPIYRKCLNVFLYVATRNSGKWIYLKGLPLKKGSLGVVKSCAITANSTANHTGNPCNSQLAINQC